MTLILKRNKKAEGLLTRIDGIPLYADKESALKWGELNGIKGFHRSDFMGVNCYSPGVSRSKAKEAIAPIYPEKVTLTKPTQKETIIEIADRDIDEAIYDAKYMGLISENTDSDLIKDELITAIVKLKEYEEQVNGVFNNVNSNPLEQLSCRECGDSFGVCVFGGCLTGTTWKFSTYTAGQTTTSILQDVVGSGGY